jgi:F-type H+-transporting ATPase subunit gamma
MSRRHDIDIRLGSLGDIGKIMGSLKNLSYMETRRLGRFLDSQRRVVAGIDAAARDFLAHHPHLLEPPEGGGTLILLIGAERGFCGDFNERVLGALDGFQSPGAAGSTALVAVGTRLGLLLEGDSRLAEAVPGASAAEEVPAVLSRLVQTLNRVGAERGLPSLLVVHWDAETEAVESVSLLPPFQGATSAGVPTLASAPCLNLAPEAFLSALIEQYLFAALHELLYGSLMAEHQQRVRQLGAALERIDERVRALGQQRNLIRQEEITEEIELILLNLPERESLSSLPVTRRTNSIRERAARE